MKATQSKANDQTIAVNSESIPLNEDTLWILGRPNFWCAPVAEMLREDGHQIQQRSESEQAAVIHWLLNLYLENGDGWRIVAQRETARIKAIHENFGMKSNWSV